MPKTRRQTLVIELERVRVTFGAAEKAVTALDATDLEVAAGEFIALVGPSGCGKSTILKLVAGTLNASAGEIYVKGREIGANPVRIGMAFQNPTLLPWMNVRDNVMLPLKIVRPYKHDFRKKRKTEYRERVQTLLESVGLGDFADKYPWQLSGGMQQRVSLCRALVHEPTLLLLDEPFGALDQFTREELWEVLQKLWMKEKPTVLLVTHDLTEAAYLANRICIMQSRPGRIIRDQSVSFDRPRTVEMTAQPDFVALRDQLRTAIVTARTTGDTR